MSQEKFDLETALKNLNTDAAPQKRNGTVKNGEIKISL